MARDDRGGIDDRRVAVIGEGGHGRHARLGRGVGGIDDAEGRGAKRHQRQRGARVVGLRDLRCQRLPKPQRLKRLPAIDACGHSIDQSHGEPAVAQQGGQVFGRGILGLRAVGDQDQPVAQKVAAGAGFDQPLVLKIGHPGGVGRNEDIRGSALCDLTRQRRRTGKGQHGVVPGRGGKRARNLFQRLFQACRGKYGDLGRPCSAGKGHRGADGKRNKAAKGTHGGSWAGCVGTP